MKRMVLVLCCLLVLAGALTACAGNGKEDVLRLFQKNEALITAAVESGDFTAVEKLSGIEKVTTGDAYIDFMCGGAGIGSSTSYFGFFYSAEDDMTAWNGGACPANGLVADGDGFRWEQKDGDNRYYVEKLGEHFFYYEASF